MPEIDDRDAITIMVEYYSRLFPAKVVGNLAALLAKADVVGLLQFTYERAVLDTRGEK